MEAVRKLRILRNYAIAFFWQRIGNWHWQDMNATNLAVRLRECPFSCAHPHFTYWGSPEPAVPGSAPGCVTGYGEYLSCTQAEPVQAIKSGVAYFTSISYTTSWRRSRYTLVTPLLSYADYAWHFSNIPFSPELLRRPFFWTLVDRERHLLIVLLLKKDTVIWHINKQNMEKLATWEALRAEEDHALFSPFPLGIDTSNASLKGDSFIHGFRIRGFRKSCQTLFFRRTFWSAL